MKGFIIAVIFLIIGGAVAGFLAIGWGTVAGIAVGSQAGVCLAMETAKREGMLSAEQIDKVIADTVITIRGKASIDEASNEIEWISSEKDCADMVAKMEADIAK